MDEPPRRCLRRALLKASLAASAAAVPIGARLNSASALAGPATPVTSGGPDALFAELDAFWRPWPGSSGSSSPRSAKS